MKMTNDEMQSFPSTDQVKMEVQNEAITPEA